MPDIKQDHTIWTPELVELSMPLAGIARRCLARLIDQVILLCICVGLFFAAISFPAVVHSSSTSVLVILFSGSCFLLIILSELLYFWAFHAFVNGKSPGKMALGIRVVTARGGKINAITSLLRSLFNIADVLLFAGGISALMILATDQEKRIADFAAGTLVIVDR